MDNKHNIQWITVRKEGGDEWKEFSKQLDVNKKIKRAIARFQSDSVCGLYINNKFIISSTGHYPQRVNCHDVTSEIVSGNNEVTLTLGTRYYQYSGEEMKNIRGYWYSSVAFELEIIYDDGSKEYHSTDKSWKAKKLSGVVGETYETAPVADFEYDTNWVSAAVWEKQKEQIEVNPQVLKVAGEKYADYLKKAVVPEYLFPLAVYETNMTSDELLVDIPFCPKERKEGEDRYVIFDFGRLIVGYTKTDYEISEKARLIQYVDRFEKEDEFEENYPRKAALDRVMVSHEITPEKNSLLNIYRRAFRYVKIIISETDKPVKITGFSVKPCMYPVNHTGWFNSDDDMLNKIWEIGKYTLHINKHQEYESCPRNECKFFSGDGIIAALTDYYAFGDSALVDASLSLTYPASSAGRVLDFSEANICGLWDYPAWWIVMLHNEYKQRGNVDFVNKYYVQALKNIEWYLSRLNNRNLIYNIQILNRPFHIDVNGVEWTDSGHRLGEKTSLNALVYHCLLLMAELSEVMNDGQAKRFREIAEKIKDAINTHLWSEEKKAYIDKEYDFIPQDGNAMAVLFGIADKERSIKALSTMRDKLWTKYGSAICDVPIDNIQFARAGFNTIAPLICSIEAEANFVLRDADNALDLIKRCWGSMIEKGAQTFWEYTPNNEKEWTVRSHAWSTGCTYVLSAYALGLRPLEYGWDKVIFDPQPGKLKELRGVVNTPLGDIAVSYVNDRYTLVVPDAMQVITSEKNIEILRY